MRVKAGAISYPAGLQTKMVLGKEKNLFFIRCIGENEKHERRKRTREKEMLGAKRNPRQLSPGWVSARLAASVFLLSGSCRGTRSVCFFVLLCRQTVPDSSRCPSGGGREGLTNSPVKPGWLSPVAAIILGNCNAA